MEVEKKTITRNGKKITVIRYAGDLSWQVLEKKNG